MAMACILIGAPPSAPATDNAAPLGGIGGIGDIAGDGNDASDGDGDGDGTGAAVTYCGWYSAAGTVAGTGTDDDRSDRIGAEAEVATFVGCVCGCGCDCGCGGVGGSRVEASACMSVIDADAFNGRRTRPCASTMISTTSSSSPLLSSVAGGA